MRGQQDFMARPGTIIGIIVLALALLFGQSLFYTVGPKEEVVVQRFGEYARTTGSGLHFKLPYPFETVTAVPTKAVRTIEFGFGTMKAGKRTQYRNTTGRDIVMARQVTGDLNLAHIEWTVQWKVHSARDYLFSVGGDERTQEANVWETISDVSEKVVRRIIGDISVDDAVTTGREQVGVDAKIEIQEIMDSFNSGVTIVKVDIQKAQPPTDKVIDAWESVNRARQEKDRLVNVALAARNDVIPAARGQKERAIKEATGYAMRITEAALGRAEAFLAQAAEYKKAPKLTKRRLYIEAMEGIMRDADVTVIDAGLGRSAVPFMNLLDNKAPVGK